MNKSISKQILVNKQITAAQVKLIANDGRMLGVMDREKALNEADKANLDLVMMNANSTPPICKLLNYSKLKYMEQKKAQKMRKAQKTIEVKEIKFRPNIQDHDYKIKLNKAREIINDGNKVKFSIRFRGREIVFKDLGLTLFERLKQDLHDIAKVAQQSKANEGTNRQVVVLFEPI